MKFKLHSRYKPKRIILLGTSGIISENLQREFKKKKLSFLKIGRKKNNFKKKSSVKLLKKLILKNDVIIFISAEAPVKNKLMMTNNLKMCKNIVNSLKERDFERLIYVSSDAVYSDTKKKINEMSKTLPESLHGKMHLKREKMLIHHFKKKLCILRPTLIYGPGDNHGGYGPNQFIKLAKFKKAITLFGNGEERRDHVYIDDVVKIICECIRKRRRKIGSKHSIWVRFQRKSWHEYQRTCKHCSPRKRHEQGRFSRYSTFTAIQSAQSLEIHGQKHSCANCATRII